MHSNKRNIDGSYTQEVSYSFIFLVGKEINSTKIYTDPIIVNRLIHIFFEPRSPEVGKEQYKTRKESM
jgi:hypothetical protein